MGSEVEGFYGLLRGVTLHSHPLPSQPPPSCAFLSPSSPAPQQSPQESAGPEVSGPVGPSTVSASAAATPAPEGDILVDMQPLRIQLGGAKRVYQCQVEGCKEGPSTSWAAICAHMRKVHLGVGLVCPLCSKSFYNLDIFRHHKKHINRNLFAPSRGGGGIKIQKFCLMYILIIYIFFHFILPHKIFNTSLYIPLPSVLCK